MDTNNHNIYLNVSFEMIKGLCIDDVIDKINVCKKIKYMSNRESLNLLYEIRKIIEFNMQFPEDNLVYDYNASLHDKKMKKSKQIFSGNSLNVSMAVAGRPNMFHDCWRLDFIARFWNDIPFDNAKSFLQHMACVVEHHE